jgi:hypothetical protein
MAVIKPTFSKVHGPSGGQDAVIITWASIGDADTCVGVRRPDLVDRSIQVEGTPGGATIHFQGSNDSVDGSNGSGNWENLTNPAGVVIAFTVPGIQQVTEATSWIRPSTGSGSGSSLTATVCARRTLR